MRRDASGSGPTASAGRAARAVRDACAGRRGADADLCVADCVQHVQSTDSVSLEVWCRRRCLDRRRRRIEPQRVRICFGRAGCSVRVSSLRLRSARKSAKTVLRPVVSPVNEIRERQIEVAMRFASAHALHHKYPHAFAQMRNLRTMPEIRICDGVGRGCADSCAGALVLYACARRAARLRGLRPGSTRTSETRLHFCDAINVGDAA